MTTDEERPGFGHVSFAESHMAKFGWEKGQGLGKNRDGISRAVSVGFKNDTQGLGAKADEWSFAWWDHVFNKTSASIQISKDETSETIQVSAQVNKKAEKALLYGSFVKATPENVVSEDKDYTIKVTDEELLKACEGRTARKGARAHQPGKLARAGMEELTGSVSDEERQVGLKRKTVSEDGDEGDTVEKKKRKKEKKEKRRKERTNEEEDKKSKKREKKNRDKKAEKKAKTKRLSKCDTPPSTEDDSEPAKPDTATQERNHQANDTKEDLCTTLAPSDPIPSDNQIEIKDKKKKKRRETSPPSETADDETAPPKAKKEKKKKTKTKTTTADADSQDRTVQKKKKKRKGMDA
ncbi:uncharacterized protein SPPG_06572 [Spizellomyces punctatus DAOM BR117]|uniref:G-patch domain-containing protein n=1 Tax=Spizellomyces punctatus (strain DAOM BR117) TaxID=645134 RepID=A0A0L0HAI6_SPIPD|nr:uncharacterized protein SPPG_06572 [Spizellomyces punctatus DAOM BR117]KNC98167.1 hypothetical protein SPPG_06572 [Spizellomyces punctatus DAOM BR117]|eukprot:XP_016606207.1 hypothetical protein SPPG_06572 [Spizellomyces punctatus DAOM BR117]